MAYALNIRSDDSSTGYVQALWAHFSTLEKQPSMQPMGYPPHIKFAVYDEIARPDLIHTFEAALSHLDKIVLQFTEFKYFEGPDSIVL